MYCYRYTRKKQPPHTGYNSETEKLLFWMICTCVAPATNLNNAGTSFTHDNSETNQTLDSLHKAFPDCRTDTSDIGGNIYSYE